MPPNWLLPDCCQRGAPRPTRRTQTGARWGPAWTVVLRRLRRPGARTPASLPAPRARRLVGNGGKGRRSPHPDPEGSPPITCRALACSPATPRFEGWARFVSSKSRTQEGEEEAESRFCYPISTSPLILGNLYETIVRIRKRVLKCDCLVIFPGAWG